MNACHHCCFRPQTEWAAHFAEEEHKQPKACTSIQRSAQLHVAFGPNHRSTYAYEVWQLYDAYVLKPRSRQAHVVSIAWWCNFAGPQIKVCTCHVSLLLCQCSVTRQSFPLAMMMTCTYVGCSSSAQHQFCKIRPINRRPPPYTHAVSI